MRVIKAKYYCRCADTGLEIFKGEECLYGYGKVYHRQSKTYQDYMTETRQEAAIEAENRSTYAMIEANENAYFDNFCQSNNL